MSTFEPVPPDVHRCQRGGRIGKAPGRAGIGGDAGKRVHQSATGVRDHRRGASRGFGHSLSADTEAAQAREAEQETGQVGQGLGGLHVRLLILQVADSLSSGHSHAFHGVFFLPVAMPRRRGARVNNGTRASTSPRTLLAHCPWTKSSRSFVPTDLVGISREQRRRFEPNFRKISDRKS